jgi:hypothetical protein
MRPLYANPGRAFRPFLLRTVYAREAMFVLAAVLVFHTYLRPQFSSFGVAGEMRLTVDKGNVYGTYRGDSGGLIRRVLGGTKGDQIWFDYEDVHIEATMKPDGSLAGVGTKRFGNGTYVFEGTPEH